MVRIGRRLFLKTGLAIPALARLQDVPRRAKGVIWLWMGGGMSQLESWDPKPRSAFKAINTAIPGIQVSEHLPTCAAQMKHLSILRTVSHGESHVERATHLLHTGVAPRSEEVPTIGMIISRELAEPGGPLPSHIEIDPPSLPPSTVFGEEQVPFLLDSRVNPIPNLLRNVDAERDRRRAALVLEQNAEWGSLHQQKAVKRLEKGFAGSEKLINTPLLRAFTWEEEPEALRKEYGGAFGENCLLARRLIQAGCAFVEIGLGGWDPQCDLAAGLKSRLTELDRGLGTLVKDLAEKGLLGQVVVVCATEYGRSPESDGSMWRGVWSRGFSILLAGGTLAGGRVHGSTGAHGRSCEPPVSVPDFLATVYRACGIDPDKEYALEEGRTWKAAPGGKPVAELF